ncbi:MAG TPA: DUF4010 domain-containing protein, partial [Acidobacteriota bacterium]|nr:DUF4010 domain-containing protein [Acidobacteriota bacterium]
RFAGVRTFLLIGLLGALSVQLMRNGLPAMGMTILAAAALLIVAAYAAAAFGGERESTTEFAAILVLAAGSLAGAGQLAVASAINAFVALVLVEKSQIHSLVFRLRSQELIAGFRFAVLALVVLPLLPPGPYGPGPGLRPRELWALVLLFSGLSFAGYIARRAIGQEHGYRVAGVLGGLISSTAVTLNFSKESRTDSAIGHALAFGVIGASTVLFLRVGLLTTILNYQLGIATLPYLWIPFAVGAAFVVITMTWSPKVEANVPLPANPLRLFSAIQMALAFQAGLYLLDWVGARYGSRGVTATAALVGVTDVDTLIFTMAKHTAIDVTTAARALTIGILSNTLLKFALALLIGKGKFRIVSVAGLLALAVGTFLSLALF